MPTTIPINMFRRLSIMHLPASIRAVSALQTGVAISHTIVTLAADVVDESYAQQINKHPHRRRFQQTPAATVIVAAGVC